MDLLPTPAGISIVWLAICGLAVLLLLAAALVALRALQRVAALERQLREVRREQQRQNTSLLALHGAMKVVAGDVFSHGHHQSTVTRKLQRLVDQQSEMRLRDVDEGLYSHAIEMIRDGRSRPEVRKLCALTESEVDLLFSLHGQGAGTSARD